MTEIANPALGRAEDVFKSLVWDPLLEGELAALFASTPWLAVWPLRQIITGLVHLVGDRLFSGVRLTLDLGAISFINAQHKRAFDTALVNLKVIEREKGLSSQEYRKAKDDAKEALSQFVRFGASR